MLVFATLNALNTDVPAALVQRPCRCSAQLYLDLAISWHFVLTAARNKYVALNFYVLLLAPC